MARANQKVENNIERLKREARDKGFDKSISAIVRLLGKDGCYVDSDFTIKHNEAKQQLKDQDVGSITTQEIIYGGQTVYSASVVSLK